MRQAVTVEPRRIDVRDTGEPAVGPADALIAVEAVGICGSDVHLFTGDHPYSRFPNVQGHEFAGRVISLPSGYDGPIRLDDRVAVEPLLTCGICLPCRRGRSNCCIRMRTFGAHLDGALSERIAVPVGLLHVANDLTPELAALVEPMSIGVHAVSRANLVEGDQVVIYGAGPIGQAILLAARRLGARGLMVDRYPERLARARTLGADETLEAGDDVGRRIVEWTRGDGPTAAFEATGSPVVVREAIDAVAPSGTVVVVGLSRDAVSIPMIEFTRKELSVVGSRNSHGQFGEAIDLVRSRAELLNGLITHRFDFEHTAEAFQVAHAQPATTEKVVILMEGH